jgi:UDP-N-acetyl-2-amino-2-deoxyglucuronate dehydrogenase
MAVGFGIVGLGMIANFHARAIHDLSGAKLLGAYSRSHEKTHEFGLKQQCRGYDDLAAMLADPAIQVVTICTPSGAHLEPALAAIRAGKHVIIEKPLEITLKRCDQILRAAEKAGVVVSTIFPSRFHESSQLMKQAVEKKRFGRITLGDAYVKWFRTQQYYDSGAWRGTWHLDGGGALMNQAIHSIDLLLWLMGPAVEVTAHTAMLAHENIEVEDVAVATVKFASGALGVIEASTAAFPGELKRIEISGSQGTAVLREEDIITWNFAKKTKADEALLERMGSKTKTGGGAADPAAIGHHGHMLQFKNVLDGITKGKQILIDGPEGRKSVEIILAIYQSAATGKAVKLPLAADPPVVSQRKSSKK